MVYPKYSTMATVSTFSARQLVKFAASSLGASRINFWYCNEELDTII